MKKKIILKESERERETNIMTRYSLNIHIFAADYDLSCHWALLFHISSLSLPCGRHVLCTTYLPQSFWIIYKVEIFSSMKCFWENSVSMRLIFQSLNIYSETQHKLLSWQKRKKMLYSKKWQVSRIPTWVYQMFFEMWIYNRAIHR